MVKRPFPRLEKLFARVRRLTKARGAKSALADFIGVNRGRMTEWLTEKFEPGGEVTLQLLEWVTAEEAKQQKETAAMSLPSQRRKTRSAKSTQNEKVQPDRKKGCHPAPQTARNKPR